MRRQTALVATGLGLLGALLAVVAWFGLGDPMRAVSEVGFGPGRRPQRPPGQRSVGAAPVDSLDYKAPPWTPELDARASRLMREDGRLVPLDCVPDPPDFDPGTIDELFFGLKFALPHHDPDGGAMRVEFPGRRGFSELRNSGEITGFVRWDVDAQPPCVFEPGPEPRADFVIADWDPNHRAVLCTTTLDVADDGSVDEVVRLDGAVDLSDGYGCKLVVYDGDVVVGTASVPLGDGAPEVVDVIERAPRRSISAASELEGLRKRLAGFGEPGDTALLVWDTRIEVLDLLIERDPELAPTLAPRRGAIAAEREEALEYLRRRYQARIDELEDEQR